jgi:exodeoxyribonuclease III
MVSAEESENLCLACRFNQSIPDLSVPGIAVYGNGWKAQSGGWRTRCRVSWPLFRRPACMKIATYNVNGIGSRQARLLEWLARESPDVVCLQELKAPDNRFPAAALRQAGYGAIWHGQTSWNGVAILARGADPVEIRRGLPGDPDDTHSRYIEAAVAGLVVGCLYLPNGNPQPGPKFDYKLAWFERLIQHARGLYESGKPVVLGGDFNVVPTDFDIYSPAGRAGSRSA